MLTGIEFYLCMLVSWIICTKAELSLSGLQPSSILQLLSCPTISNQNTAIEMNYGLPFIVVFCNIDVVHVAIIVTFLSIVQSLSYCANLVNRAFYMFANKCTVTL